MPRVREDELDNTLDLPSKESMRESAPAAAQRRNMSTDDKKSNRRAHLNKEALQLSFNHTSSYSGPGYYVIDKYGAPQEGPFKTYSLAIANLNGRDGIQFMDQAETAPINEPFPPQFNTVMGSKKTLCTHCGTEINPATDNNGKTNWTHAQSPPKGGWGHVAYPTPAGEKPLIERNSSLRVEAILDERIDDAYERHLQWSKANGHDPDTVEALRAHEKARGITRAEANGIADQQYIGGGDTDWRSQANRDERTASMSIQHREAELLERMARNPHEASALMVELESLRRDERVRIEASRETDLANAFISDLRTPVPTYSHHTAATDWIGEDHSVDPGEVTNRILTSASLWYSKLSPEVKADRDEFLAQAHGYFRREASQFGLMAGEAFQMAMSHVDRINQINHTANNETLLPWSVVVPPLPPSMPAGDDMNTNHVPGPGNPGQPMPWSNDAEHAVQPGSPSTTEAMGQAGQVNTFYPNQDATQEPNDDGALTRQGASYATGPYSTPIDLNDTWMHEPSAMIPQENNPPNPAEVASASSRTNLAFWPNQDATEEPHDDGLDSYPPGGVGDIGGSPYDWHPVAASLRRLGDDDKAEKVDSDEEIAKTNEEMAKNKGRRKQRNFPNSRTASENFNGPKTSYQEYLQKISEGATPVSEEFWSGMAAATSPNDATSRREARFHPLAAPLRRQAGDAPNREDPTGANLGHNPPAWNGGSEDPQQAYAQSGTAQSSLPYAPQPPQVAQTFSNISDFPDTGPTEVNADAMNRYSRRQVEAGRPVCQLCGQYGHSEEAHDDDPLYANWTDTRPWGKPTRDDSVWGYPEEGRGIGRPRVAAKDDDVDRDLYAQSPGGHQSQDNQAYSSDRHTNWTDMPQGPPEVSDHAAGGVPTSFLGTVPVQGYAQDAEHPNGEFFPWQDNPPGSGAADVASVPTPGIQSQMATGTSWPQPQVGQKESSAQWPWVAQ